MAASPGAHRRLNISLPETTISRIDRLAQTGNRSRFIQQAVDHYVECMGRQRLRQLLMEGGRKRAERDRSLADEWFPVDESGYRKSGR
jgi:CopG family transcriptional regulator/antitoxin EndoAI